MYRDNEIMLDAWLTIGIWIVVGLGAFGGLIYLFRSLFSILF